MGGGPSRPKPNHISSQTNNNKSRKPPPKEGNTSLQYHVIYNDNFITVTVNKYIDAVDM